MRSCAALLLLLTLSTGEAAEMLSIEVEYEEGVYTLNSEVWFDASVAQVYEVFRHWDYSTEFSSAIVESRDVEPGEDGRPRFYVRNHGCVLFFCKSFERHGFVEARVNEVIYATTDPDLSDFHLCDESWSFERKDGGTVVTYELAMTPKFWVPPGIGPYLLKRKMKNKSADAMNRIEVIAQGLASE